MFIKGLIYAGSHVNCSAALTYLILTQPYEIVPLLFVLYTRVPKFQRG